MIDRDDAGTWSEWFADLTPHPLVVAFVVCVLVGDSCRTRVDILTLRDRVEVLEEATP